jgi:iron only hydrogenase large subunit-like protein
MQNVLTLKKSNCKNCYKCIRNCPVKSIRFSGGQAHIIGDDCILCGRCFVVCPQNAKEIVNDTEKVRVMLMDEEHPVIVSLAPSFIANYDGVGIESMKKALKQLGFSDVEETAIGATMVKREYERMLKEEDRDIIISSCCHSVNLLIRKYFPMLLKYLADVVTPMQAHCMDIKRRNPNARTVFIGPCVAKKAEAEESSGAVDAVLTFEELTEWLAAEKIQLEKEIIPNEESRARFFPTSGGILKTMSLDAPGYTYLTIDGSVNCISALKDIKHGKISRCFIEMSLCSGSCICGPVMEKYHKNPVRDYVAVARYAGTKDFSVDQPDIMEMRHAYLPVKRENIAPMEYEITEILHDLGKFKPEDELNCGSCGYNSCREKAIAIFQGKADKYMCLPFLKEKAENMSDSILRNSPNAVFVINDQMEVQQMNSAAVHLVNLRGEKDILGENVVRILDPLPFLKVQQTGKSIMNQREYLAEYRKYVEQTIVPIENGRGLLCLMRDVTDAEEERQRREEISRETVEVANKVVDKQMRIVQEIASLLGETAAETKIALAKLKEFISEE